MSWIEKLYETYDLCVNSEGLQGTSQLTPLFHAIQQAHIEVILDGNGNFRRARVIQRENTVIPVTEKSATARTSAVVPHPLCDHVKYCAGDYKEPGKNRNIYFDAYHAQLRKWCESPDSHPKAIAVLRYVEKRSVVGDLVREGVLPVDTDGQLLRRWEPGNSKPPLFGQLTRDPKTDKYKPQNALIRWRVQVESDMVPEVWKDNSVQQAWLAYSMGEDRATGFCMVTGMDQVLATKHAKGVRGGKDGAKLISWKKEDESDFIYLGRFLEANQVVGVGREVSQKAHSSLRWLIERQGYRNGDQAIVTWAVAGKPVPDPFQDSRSLFLAADELQQLKTTEDDQWPNVGDVGQAFAGRLNKAVAGYRAKLDPTDDIVIIALDSATKGRLAITFYRELTGSEFLDRVLAWHEASAWHQDYGKDPRTKKDLRFIGAPSPKDIADAAFGPPHDKKKSLHKATVERLLPCIIDGRPLPRDLSDSAVCRACNRAGLDHREWEKTLGIACAVFKGLFKERRYAMTLETDRATRDYLYGRLLAIAEHIEGRALWIGGETRDTTAARLMQRFADRPASTWRNIATALTPYKRRLRAKRSGELHQLEERLDDVMGAFNRDDFLDDRRLSGEFLLGYHCERRALRSPQANTAPTVSGTDSDATTEGEVA